MVRNRCGVTRSAALRTRSTVTILCGLTLTCFVLACGVASDHAIGIFAQAAVGIGLCLSIATAIEAVAGVRNIIRVDIVALWVLYGLTFFEFLFPQRDVDSLVSPEAALSGTYAAFLGFAGLVIGRHLVRRRNLTFIDVRPAAIFMLFTLATFFGFFHVFLAVDFDPLEALRQMSLPRFDQSWGRGRYGDARAMLYEIGAVLYLVPPIAGLIYARSRDYNFGQKAVVTFVLLFTFYFGFSSGTRNILATYVITFLGAFFLNRSEFKISHLLYQGFPIIAVLLLAMSYMLDFRREGLASYSFAEELPTTIFIDHNMVTISRIAELFPNESEYLGLEIPYWGLIHPIPRFLWPGKPETLSFSIEEAFGLNPGTVTLAATFIGEMYMSGGLVVVLVAGLLLGAIAEYWNRLGADANSPFQKLLYASGFLCAAITMRSTMWMSTMALPTLALWIYGKWLTGRSSRRPSAVRDKGMMKF
jgi:hypothetical protein